MSNWETFEAYASREVRQYLRGIADLMPVDHATTYEDAVEVADAYYVESPTFRLLLEHYRAHSKEPYFILQFEEARFKISFLVPMQYCLIGHIQ